MSSSGQVYDDYSLRGSLEQTRAGSPPRWVRVVDVACTPGEDERCDGAGTGTLMVHKSQTSTWDV